MKYLIAMVAGLFVFGYGEANAAFSVQPVIYKSTNVAAAESIVNLYSGRAVVHCVILSSAVAGANFTVYDSSDTTTSGRNILINIYTAANPVPQYCLDVETTYGISIIAVGTLNAVLTYLENK